MTAELTADIIIRPVPKAIAQAKALLSQGIELAKLQEFERAIAHFTQSIRLALALLKPNANSDTISTRSLSVAEVTTVEITATQSFYHRGCAFSRVERYDRAIADFTHLIQQPPTSSAIPANWLISKLTEIYIHRGNAHRRLGEYSRALLDLNQAINRSGSAQSYSCRGLLYLDTENLPKATEDFSAAIEQHPTFAQAYLWRGFAYLRNNNSLQAIADLNHAIAAIPTCAEAYNHRGIAHLYQHNLSQAKADFSQAIRLNPSFAEAYNNRGNIHQLLGDRTRAAIDHEQVTALHQSTEVPYTVTSPHSLNNATVYRHHAQIKEKEGQIATAIADYTKAISISPTAHSLYKRGQLYERIGEKEKALADFDRALAISPDYAEVYCDRSHLRFQSHDLLGTLSDTNKSIELSPNNHNLKETFITRCLAHFSTSNKQQALADFEQLVTTIKSQNASRVQQSQFKTSKT